MATNKNITMKQFNGVDYDTLYPKTKLEQVEGAYTQQQILADSTKTLYGLGSDAVPDDLFKTLGAELIVTTEAGTVVTASRNGVTLSATADSSGLAIFKIPTFGTWTLKATVNGKTLEFPFVIDSIAVFNTSMTTDLETASWGLISAVAEAGNAASFWSVGAKKTFKLDGVSYTAQIIGFNHDTKTAGGKAGITFQLVDCLIYTYKMDEDSSSANDSRWKSSIMHYHMSEFFNQLNDDLQSVIKPVNKLVAIGNNVSTIETVSDRLFLLSEVEVFGSNTNSFAGEGSQYAWYKAGNTKVKKVNGSKHAWWERSPAKDYSSGFCAVNNSGSADSFAPIAELGVSFAFCV